MQVKLLNGRRWKTRLELADALVECLQIFRYRPRRYSLLGMLGSIDYEIRYTDNVACDQAS